MIPHSAGSILQNKERIKRVIFQNKKWDAEWFFKLKKKKWDYSSKFEENFKEIDMECSYILMKVGYNKIIRDVRTSIERYNTKSNATYYTFISLLFSRVDLSVPIKE